METIKGTTGKRRKKQQKQNHGKPTNGDHEKPAKRRTEYARERKQREKQRRES